MVIHKSNSDLLADPAPETELGRMSGLGDILYYLNVYKEYLLNIFSLKNSEAQLHFLAISKRLKPRPHWICHRQHPGKSYFNTKHPLKIHLGRENSNTFETVLGIRSGVHAESPEGI